MLSINTAFATVRITVLGANRRFVTFPRPRDDEVVVPRTVHRSVLLEIGAGGPWDPVWVTDIDARADVAHDAGVPLVEDAA